MGRTGQHFAITTTLAVAWILAAAAIAPASAQPSFDCSRARLTAEFTICGNTRLQALDRELNAVFQRAISSASPIEQGTLRNRQRQWLDRRNRCGRNVQCLVSAYEAAVRTVRRGLERFDTTGPGAGDPRSVPFNRTVDDGFAPSGSITETGDIGADMLGDGDVDVETVVNAGAGRERETPTASGLLYDHNGSGMLMEIRSDAVTILYRNPKSSITRLGVSAGTPLFEGTLEGNRLNGTARTFRSGCSPARYTVNGTFAAGSSFTLRGLPPRRASGSCRVIGTDPGSSNAVLGFRFIRKLY